MSTEEREQKETIQERMAEEEMVRERFDEGDIVLKGELFNGAL